MNFLTVFRKDGVIIKGKVSDCENYTEAANFVKETYNVKTVLVLIEKIKPTFGLNKANL